MALRDAINQHPRAVAVAAVVLVVLMVGIGVAQHRGGTEAAPSASGSAGAQAFFTSDDGKTWFPLPENRLSPTKTADGKTAVKCYVWSCDGGKTKFVSHLERLRALERKDYPEQAEVAARDIPPGVMEVKVPLTGEQGWLSEGVPQARAMMTPKCPNGRSGDRPQPVLPGT
jgi:hypothetical protein